MSRLLKEWPLATSGVLILLSEASFTCMSAMFPSVCDLEWTDVFSTMLAMISSALFYFQSSRNLRQSMILLFVSVWAVRLGSFLATRNLGGFHDKRLDQFRNTAGRVKWWLGQTAWCWITLLPVWVGIGGSEPQLSLGAGDLLGALLFCMGLGLEATADRQKKEFLQKNAALRVELRKPACNIGLFKYSRFPQYFGEMLLWTGTCIVAASAHSSLYRYLPALCPIFLYIIFTKLSMPLAEASVRRRATDQEFEAWKAMRPLIPMPTPK